MVSERLSPFRTDETSGERSITLAPNFRAAVLKLNLVLVLGSKNAVAIILSASVFGTDPGLLRKSSAVSNRVSRSSREKSRMLRTSLPDQAILPNPPTPNSSRRHRILKMWKVRSSRRMARLRSDRAQYRAVDGERRSGDV